MRITLPFSIRKSRRTNTKTIPLYPSLSKHNNDVVQHGFDGSSFIGAVFNLSTTIVGAGIMALPSAVKQLGLIPGLGMIILGAMLTEASIDILLKFTRVSKSTTYSGVVCDSFGEVGRILLLLCIIVSNIGMLVVYMIIIGDVFSGTWSEGVHYSGVLEEWFGQHWWSTRPVLLLLTMLLVFLPLASFRRVDSLRYTSALSVGLAVVFVVITAGVATYKFIDGSIGMPRLMPKFTGQESFWKLFTTIPILVTAYICHHNVHPIDNELKDPTHMKSIVRTSLLLCASVYVATSLFGFFLFGDKTQDDVLANFDGDLGIPYGSFLNDVVRMSYGAHLILVFPIVFYSLRLNVDGLLFPHAIPLAFDNQRFYLVTIVLLVFIFLGANFVPSIWDAFQFTGATASVSAAFIFPAAIAIRDTRGFATKKDKRLSWLMILLAISSSTVAISSDLYSIFSSEAGATART
ncbi:PREDICTED: probable sodium-coupled neutral amino acid transporter 6 isoform X1 [Lupinus angustifolius]|uniref:probable sodium-coupled neutral amino acid transporter 6 isoform X1 n=1 Tax=Lupinus angustifolius TaxID=3871 RepID=UPI00092FA1EA|nr:PREDICTED: probable sodium-coupled neutral amino acid transporter 6 isoform X1 [Lupinus angustifolius]